MKVGFFTYGNHQMGMGHVYRCISLAKVIKKKWTEAKIIFEIRESSETMRLLREHDHILINSYSPGVLPKGRWDLLMVDQLSVAPGVMKHLKKNCRVLVSLDDIGLGHYEADLSINSIYACCVNKPPESQTITLVGFSHLIMDPAFGSASYIVRDQVRELLISQGGADTYGIIPQLVTALGCWLEEVGNIRLNIHIGPAFKHEAELSQAIKEYKTPVLCHRGTENMLDLFLSMDIAISGVGIMACELAALGVPTVLVTGEEKELETASMFEESEIAINMKKYDSSKNAMLINALQGLINKKDRDSLSVRSRTLIDGNGAERIINHIVNLLNETN